MLSSHIQALLISFLSLALIPVGDGYLVPSTPTITKTFVRSLAGEFCNAAQAQRDPRFFGIKVWYRPMPQVSDDDGIKEMILERLGNDAGAENLLAYPFFTESAILKKGNEPYKKNVVVVVLSNGRIRLQSYRVKDETRDRFIGKARMGEEGLLHGITAECLEHMSPGCDMVVDSTETEEGVQFVGKFACEGGCRFRKGKHGTYLNAKLDEAAESEVYLDSKIELQLREDGRVAHYKSQDNFRDVKTGEPAFAQGDKGPYVFEKTAVWTPSL